MQMNAWRMRLAAIAVGVTLLGLFLLMGGSFGPGGKGVVQIEYGMYPQELNGCTVVIDGEAVGTLHRFGNSNRTGFQVSEGEHTIVVRHPKLPCATRRFTAQSTLPLLLVADIRESYRDGKTRTEIVLGH